LTKKYILSSLSISLNIIFTILLTIGLIEIKPYSNIKIFFIILLIITSIILSIITYLNKNIKIYNAGIFITLLLNIILVYNVIDLNIKYDYIRNLHNQDYEYVTYNIYVQKKNVYYSNIDKLDGKKIGTLSNKDNICPYLNNVINIKCQNYQNADELQYAIENGEIQSIILTEEEYSNLSNDSNNLETKIRNIYSTKIKEAKI